jgi:hypothetical protein
VPETTVDIFDIAERLLDAQIDPTRLDSRDLIEIREKAHEEIAAPAPPNVNSPSEELVALVKEIDRIEQETGDEFPYGTTYIPRSDFVEYAQEFAEDIGAIGATPSNAEWPMQHIDWKAAADELAIDYTEIDIAGKPYLFRS